MAPPASTWFISSPLLRAIAFGTIGLTGIGVNTALLWLFSSVAGMHYLLAAALATQGSTVWNFVWIDLGVYHGARGAASLTGSCASGP